MNKYRAYANLSKMPSRKVIHALSKALETSMQRELEYEGGGGYRPGEEPKPRPISNAEAIKIGRQIHEACKRNDGLVESPSELELGAMGGE